MAFQQQAAPAPAGGDYDTVGSILGGLDLKSAGKSLTPVGQLGSGVEYIFTDDTPFMGASGGFVPSRGFGDDLCYGTGTAYLTGLTLGGTWGFLQGMRAPLEIRSTKLRVNAVLNAMTRRGPFVGNSFGVLAVMYSFVNYAVAYPLDVTPDQKPYVSIVSAAASGALFKSTAGLRSAGITGAVCGSLAIVWQATKSIREELPIIGAITTRSF
ncbi:Mitochondrial import inner membrane translocase subunit tim23 [Blastocladiella emersonii ATCC 22665]|nr:Mitochondrial import inner membrane translocase subunit tim23 [Blastocladiella emersonii ATCC 22665]